MKTEIAMVKKPTVRAAVDEYKKCALPPEHKAAAKKFSGCSLDVHFGNLKNNDVG